MSEHEDAEIITKPLDSVLLQLKIMDFPDIRGSLQGCITPPDDSQVLHEGGYRIETPPVATMKILLNSVLHYQ